MVIGESNADLFNSHANILENAEKEVQDTSCRGGLGVSPIFRSAQDWGIRGLIEIISAVSYDD